MTQKKDNSGRIAMDILQPTNDGWVNPHCRVFLEHWQANIDFRLTIDVGKIVGYMTKYITKSDTSNNAKTDRFLTSTLKHHCNSNDSTTKILRKIMGKLMGSRAVSKQETAHKINNESFVWKSHSGRRVNLRNNQRRISGNGAANIQSVGAISVMITIIDAYAKRYESKFWAFQSNFLDVEKELDGMTLNKFANKYVLFKSGANKNKIKHAPKKTFVIFSPKLSNNKKFETYPEYCKLSLVRFKAWKDDIHTAYGGEDSTEDDWKNAWDEFLLNYCRNERAPDAIAQELRLRLEQHQQLSNDLVGDRMDEGDNGEATKQLDCVNLVDFAGDPEDDGFEIENCCVNLPEFQQEQCEGINTVGNFGEVKTRQRQLLENVVDASHHNLESVDREELNTEQKRFFDVIQILLRYDKHESATDGGNGFHRGVILKGRGGTGKSTTINAIRIILGPNKECTTATTGKAATLLNGSTIYSPKGGLALPVGGKKYAPLQGKILLDLQKRFREVQVLFLDEYSMLPQKQLYYIDKRLKEIKANDRVFGGIVVVLIGDLAQLPPVQATPAYDQRMYMNGNKKDLDSQCGRKIWSDYFRTVIKLSENKRLDPTDPDAADFNRFLECLADGNVTENQYKQVIKICSRDTLGEQEWRERGFNESSTTHLFTRNVDVRKKNYEEIQSLNQPILKVIAYNSSATARAKHPDFFQQMPNHEYFSRGAKVLLTKNLKPEYGLANGTTGIVKDFIWNDDDRVVTHDNISDACNLFVWVDFGKQYSGPSFFDEETYSDRLGWFPIFALNSTNFEVGKAGQQNGGYKMLGRVMLPLKLAWAWTIHKSQGQTIKEKIVLHLGDDEKTVGLSYVAFSRAKRFSNVGIQGGLSANRIMTLISKKPSLKIRKIADERLDKHFEETTAKLEIIQQERMARAQRNVFASTSANFYDPDI